MYASQCFHPSWTVSGVSVSEELSNIQDQFNYIDGIIYVYCYTLTCLSTKQGASQV